MYHKNDLKKIPQTKLPLTLIPIRINLDIPAYTPDPPIPAHSSFHPPKPCPPSRLNDFFLWNLHEVIITPDQFALTLAQDLDLPNQMEIARQISIQIRTQLEEYAGVALHPLFHTTTDSSTGVAIKAAHTPLRDASSTPIVPGTPRANGQVLTNGHSTPLPIITATAVPVASTELDEYNLDDTYRCIIHLNINLQSRLYTDRFEWSLLHGPGTAEIFSKQTCADLGLSGEWVPAMAHAIYEAVLRLKKEACESGGLVGGNGLGGEIDNMAANGADAGWRFDNEHLADDWEPKVEELSKEEIAQRETDRERQIRRLRRETARFSSNTGMIGDTPRNAGYFDNTESTEQMGRGERNKRKRRFRSLSPVGRGGTPGGRGTPDVGTGTTAGYGGAGGTLTEYERPMWKCSHCAIPGSGVWAVRDGPRGPRVNTHPVLNILIGSLLTISFFRPSATTAVSYTSAIVNFPHG
jgi:chromatin structure-remodeling complex subunit SFH1